LQGQDVTHGFALDRSSGLDQLHTPPLSDSSAVDEPEIEDHGDEQEDKLNWSHGLMSVQQIGVNDECERQKYKAQDGNDDPVNRAEEIRKQPKKDNRNAWKCYSQQRK
jgi:hypothetical protein